MNPILLDTSILGRLANVTEPAHFIAVDAVAEMRKRGFRPVITPQNLIEFRNGATRAKSLNGLGLTLSEAEQWSDDFEKYFGMIEDSPAVFPSWKSIVKALGVIGKQVHDARLVAVCHVNTIAQILTFNVGHFQRFAAFGPGLVVVDPRTV